MNKGSKRQFPRRSNGKQTESKSGTIFGKKGSRVRYSKGYKCKTLKFKQTASPKIKGMTKAMPFLFEIYSLVNFISGKTIAISFSSSFGFHHSMKRTVAVEGE